MVLFTAAEFRTRQGVRSTAHDERIAALAVQATAVVETYCRRTFAEAEYVEDIDGTGTAEIRVSNPPVVSIASILIAADRDFSAVTAIEDTVHSRSSIVRRLSGTFPCGKGNVRITYTGGYAIIPADVKAAAIALAGAWFNTASLSGITSATIGSVTQTLETDLPRTVRRLLGPHRTKLL